MQRKLFDMALERPKRCPHELERADIGKGKSYCDLMGRWTNCLEVGRCIAYDLGKEVREWERGGGGIGTR